MATKIEENIVYNEKKYMPLTGNNVLRRIEQIRICEESAKQYSNKLFSKSISEYNKFIELVAKLVKELGIPNNSISISIVLAKLIDYGYFSNRNIFIYKESSTEISGHYGMNVVNGKGCCRNITSFCKDVFDELKMYNHPMPCVANNSITLTEAYETIPNHIVNVIQYERKLYAYDIGNILMFNFINGFKLESFLQDKKQVLFYKPSMDMVYNNISICEVIENIRRYNETTKIPIISKEHYENIVYDTMKNIREKRDILLDFKKESKKHIKKITLKR